jgi:hypothetical protein
MRLATECAVDVKMPASLSLSSSSPSEDCGPPTTSDQAPHAPEFLEQTNSVAENERRDRNRLSDRILGQRRTARRETLSRRLPPGGSLESVHVIQMRGRQERPQARQLAHVHQVSVIEEIAGVAQFSQKRIGGGFLDAVVGLFEQQRRSLRRQQVSSPAEDMRLVILHVALDETDRRQIMF